MSNCWAQSTIPWCQGDSKKYLDKCLSMVSTSKQDPRHALLMSRLHNFAAHAAKNCSDSIPEWITESIRGQRLCHFEWFTLLFLFEQRSPPLPLPTDTATTSMNNRCWAGSKICRPHGRAVPKFDWLDGWVLVRLLGVGVQGLRNFHTFSWKQIIQKSNKWHPKEVECPIFARWLLKRMQFAQTSIYNLSTSLFGQLPTIIRRGKPSYQETATHGKIALVIWHRCTPIRSTSACHSGVSRTSTRHMGHPARGREPLRLDLLLY